VFKDFPDAGLGGNAQEGGNAYRAAI
jgi:hypothetical protein